MLSCVPLGFILEEDFVSVIYYFKFIYFVQDLFFEAGEIEILDLYDLYHILGVNVIYGIQWLLKRTDFKYFSLNMYGNSSDFCITKRIRLRFLCTDPKKVRQLILSEGFSSVLHRTEFF